MQDRNFRPIPHLGPIDLARQFVSDRGWIEIGGRGSGRSDRHDHCNH